MKLIDKDTVVAEIERLQCFFVNEHDDFEKGYHHTLRLLKSFLDTLETKEVDLEKEATEFIQTKEFVESKENPILLIAKYFFELGLKTQKGK